jgi:rare lipoprotein A
VAFGLAFGAFCAAASFHSSDAVAAQCGKASWYKMGSRTASGEPMNANALAAAHRTLPFGTQVRVENLANHRSVIVRINDRGPYVGCRVIDVTRGAAVQLGMISSGTARVKVSVIDDDGDGKPVLNGCSS